jgi:peptide-methionine (S)-S-oxide reductase
VQVDYDPSVISYEELLELFWSGHDPTQVSFSRQYANIVFYHNEEQERLGRATAEREADRRGKTVRTAMQPIGTFYLAEDYHQKYYLRQNQAIWPEIAAYYGQDDEGLVASTAAARLNGYLGGHGRLDQFDAIANELGLSDEGQATIRAILERQAHRLGLDMGMSALGF